MEGKGRRASYFSAGLAGARVASGASRLRARLVGGPLIALVAAAWSGGCGGSTPAPQAAVEAHSKDCAADETREYQCEDFLPTASALPAPPPYQACPSSLGDPVGNYEPAPASALFDAHYTEYTRKRAPPGHSCCYSWCSKLTLADPSAPSAQAACQMANAFREEYCMGEPEGGTSQSAGGQFDRCPSAIVPPSKAVFSAPEAALFDPTLTAARRGKGQADCCYAWCSQAPPGSGLHK